MMLVDVTCLRSVRLCIRMQDAAFNSATSNSISDADDCNQTTVDIVHSCPADNAASGSDVTCYSLKEECIWPPASPPSPPAVSPSLL